MGAEVALVVRDGLAGKGIGRHLLSYMESLARRYHGYTGFTAEVLTDNGPMLHLFDTMGWIVHRSMDGGVVMLEMAFSSSGTLTPSEPSSPLSPQTRALCNF
eukprot:NODE_3816_length_402_cov_83.855524_g3378_i0.p2 GENE.NODE_3816_length_402_cov_83.855524_g3378_i0~~NODE_3816_length_402_cov_83.855524_g3378_i0.p2  ORF type:complete len:109 (-),score=35.06 NODE_3816_length_402_cov_83.855524_g3378_i0:76-381(-)